MSIIWFGCELLLAVAVTIVGLLSLAVCFYLFCDEFEEHGTFRRSGLPGHPWLVLAISLTTFTLTLRICKTYMSDGYAFYLGTMAALAATVLGRRVISLADREFAHPGPPPVLPVHRTSARHLLLIARHNADVDELLVPAHPLRCEFPDFDAEWLKLRLFAAETAIERFARLSDRAPLAIAFGQEMRSALGIPDTFLEEYRILTDGQRDNGVGYFFAQQLIGRCDARAAEFGRIAFAAALAASQAYIETALRPAWEATLNRTAVAAAG